MLVNKERQWTDNDVAYKIFKVESFEYLRNKKEDHIYRIILPKYSVSIIKWFQLNTEVDYSSTFNF